MSGSFQDFHKYADLWEKHLEGQHQDQIRNLLEGNGLILFFIKDSEVFGAGEDSRVTFARMKNPSEEEGTEWANEATFGAFNLTKALHGHAARSVFSKKDLKSLKIIEQQEAEKLLNQQAKKASGNVVTTLGNDETGEEPGVPPTALKLGDDT
jgi:hypothetical protein